MVDAPRSQSVSQSANQLASELDHKLGTDTKGLNDTEKDLNRFERQTDSKIAKWGFKVLGGVFGFGRNMCTPFQETAKDLDRLARQTDSAVGKKAYQTLGAAFGFGSTAFKLPNDIVMGMVDFATNPVGAITSLPAAIQHNGDAMISGVTLFTDGRTAEGTALFTEGAVGDAMIVGAVTGMVKGAPKVYAAYTDGVNAVLKAATDRRPTTFNADPFDIVARNNMEFGGIRFGIGDALTALSKALDTAARNFTNSLHNDWRVSRSIVEGTAADGSPLREPRWKAVAADDASLSKIPDQFKRTADGKTEVDIANLDFDRLPAKYQFKNSAAATGAVSIIGESINASGAVTVDIEAASAKVHQQWLDRNGSWAPAEQNKPYAELSDFEKEKDRVVVRAAAQAINDQMKTAGQNVTVALLELGSKEMPLPQAEMFGKFKPVLDAQGKAFTKHGEVFARVAEAGEIIETRTSDGRVETTNTANAGDYIVRNPTGEEYIISVKKFAARYKPTEGSAPKTLDGQSYTSFTPLIIKIPYSHE